MGTDSVYHHCWNYHDHYIMRILSPSPLLLGQKLGGWPLHQHGGILVQLLGI